MFANLQSIGVSSPSRPHAPTKSLGRRSITTVVSGPGLDHSVSPFSRDGRNVPPPIVREGEVIGGRYRVEEIVGEGGMGVVVAARHVELGHRVAVKFLRAGVAGREDVVARFRWEARASLQIQSEHVVRVTDAGTSRDGAPYLVMELLDGIDLGALLKRRGPLPVEEAADYVLQACEDSPRRTSWESCTATSSPKTSSSPPGPTGRHS